MAWRSTLGLDGHRGIRTLLLSIVGIGLVAGLVVLGMSQWQQRSQMSGLYTFGHEVETFQRCRGKHVFWVTGVSSLLQQMQQQHADLTVAQPPYTPVFVRVRAQRSKEPTDGFAADYDGLMEIHQLISMTPVLPPDCKPPQ